MANDSDRKGADVSGQVSQERRQLERPKDPSKSRVQRIKVADDRPLPIRFYCNGDQFYGGQLVYVSSKRYPSLDRLLMDLSRRLLPDTVRLPYGVRQIFAIDDGLRIRTIDDLIGSGRREFVCAGFETYRSLQYSQTCSQRWTISKNLTSSLSPTGTIWPSKVKFSVSLDCEETAENKDTRNNKPSEKNKTSKKNVEPSFVSKNKKFLLEDADASPRSVLVTFIGEEKVIGGTEVSEKEARLPQSREIKVNSKKVDQESLCASINRLNRDSKKINVPKTSTETPKPSLSKNDTKLSRVTWGCEANACDILNVHISDNKVGSSFSTISIRDEHNVIKINKQKNAQKTLNYSQKNKEAKSTVKLHQKQTCVLNGDPDTHSRKGEKRRKQWQLPQQQLQQYSHHHSHHHHSQKQQEQEQKLVAESEFLAEKFDIGEVLGDGNFAVVKICSARATGMEYAMKIISKWKLKGKEKVIENEVSILRRCSHPNIVRLFESYETKAAVYLILELVKGGDLFEAIRRSRMFSEPQSSTMVKDMAKALNYLHSRNIVHRDVKPENFLVQRREDGTIERLKLADFGLAVETTRLLFKLCGTPTYVAPEIISDIGYGSEVDMWSVGVILYILLSGYPPFRTNGRSDSELFDLIQLGQFVFDSPHCDHISHGAQDLIRRLLEITVRKRIKAEEVLCHPWIRNGGVGKMEDEEFHLITRTNLPPVTAVVDSTMRCQTPDEGIQKLETLDSNNASISQ